MVPAPIRGVVATLVMIEQQNKVEELEEDEEEGVEEGEGGRGSTA